MKTYQQLEITTFTDVSFLFFLFHWVSKKRKSRKNKESFSVLQLYYTFIVFPFFFSIQSNPSYRSQDRSCFIYTFILYIQQIINVRPKIIGRHPITTLTLYL